MLPDVDAHAAIGLQRARAHRERLALSGELRAAAGRRRRRVEEQGGGGVVS